MSLESVNFKFTPTNLKLFLDKMKELSKIGDKVVLKLNDNNVLMYSMVGKGKQIHAFRSFIFETNTIINLTNKIDKEIIFIINDSKKIVRDLSNFLDDNDDIKCELNYSDINEVYYSDIIKFKNNILKLNVIGGDPIGVNTDFTQEIIEKFSDITKSLFNFDLNRDLLARVKKMSTIEKGSDVVKIKNKDGKISIGETKWWLKVIDGIESENGTYTLPKKYFNSISIDGDSVKIFVFETFILVRSDKSDLLITLETTV